MLRECCERGAMIQALLGVVPPAFRISELNFLNNPGEPMSRFGPIFGFDGDVGYGPKFMRRMRVLHYFPYMRLRADGIGNGSIQYDYVFYASEIARMDLMYRHGRVGHGVNRLTLPIVNPKINSTWSELRDYAHTGRTKFEAAPMYEFDLVKMMYRNKKIVKNLFSYIPRLNIHKKSPDGSIEYKVIIGETTLPLELVHDTEFCYKVMRMHPGFFSKAFVFCSNICPCAMFNVYEFNGVKRKINRWFSLH